VAAGRRSLEREFLVGGLLVAVVGIGVLLALLLLVEGPVDPAAIEPASLDVVQVAPAAKVEVVAPAAPVAPAPPPAVEPEEEPDLPRTLEPSAPPPVPGAAEGTVRGRVHTETGAPIVDARVQVERGRRLLDEGNTSATGEFAIGPLEAGHLRLTVSHPDYAEAVLRYPQIPAEPLDITLRQGGMIEGKVVDDRSGQPMAHAAVRAGLGGPGGQAAPNVNTVLDRGTRSDDTGTFRLEGLPLGQVNVVASAPGYAVSAPETVQIQAGTKVTNLTLRLQREGVVDGRVVDDADGKPIPRALVVFRPPYPAGPRRARTAADGSFKLKGVSPGTVSIEITRTGYMTRWLSGLNVSPGESLSNVEVRLQRPGGALAPGGGTTSQGLVHSTPKLQYAGIGARLGKAESGVRIESVFPDSPAAQVGLQQGDVILEVDGKSLGAMDLTLVVEMIKGEEGRMVSLMVRRADGRTEFIQPVRQLLNL